MATESPLHLVATVSLPFEAEHIQQVLQSAGLEVYVDGLHGANNFAFNATMGSIKVRVRAPDAARAEEILREARNKVGTAWYCGRCSETNEANFDMCWKCGGERTEVEGQPPASTAPTATSRPTVHPDDLLSPYRTGDSNAGFNPSPYATPGSPPSAPDPAQVPSSARDEQALEELDDVIQRAYRASVFGLVTLPILLHIYSLITLLGALSIPAPFSPRNTWRFRIAMGINLAVVAACVYIVLQIRAS
ncbi:MAG: DUF2007 domain-containing protein [Pirellulaceae bacterium]|nr:DUF2007 domain-containing protein [Pirellulaceae bacterium]